MKNRCFKRCTVLKITLFFSNRDEFVHRTFAKKIRRNSKIGLTLYFFACTLASKMRNIKRCSYPSVCMSKFAWVQLLNYMYKMDFPQSFNRCIINLLIVKKRAHTLLFCYFWRGYWSQCDICAVNIVCWFLINFLIILLHTLHRWFVNAWRRSWRKKLLFFYFWQSNGPSSYSRNKCPV